MSITVVDAISIRTQTMDPLYLFTLGFIKRGPHADVECGQCGLHFEGRVPLTRDPALRCPFCEAVNRLPVTLR